MDAETKNVPKAGLPAWPVLVVDDDADMLAITSLVLGQVRFAGRPLELVNASSAAEARQYLAKRSDFAIALLDVVMETEHAGLDLVRHIREDLGNSTIRVVLRTGQPGQAPEDGVVSQYDIDGYLSKAGATGQHLVTLVTTSLRTFDLIRRLEHRQLRLEHSNRELERFAFAASHDLQTPLRNILRLTQLLMRKSADKLDAESRELLLLLSDNAGILHRLIEDLLEYARIGNVRPVFKPVKLDEVLQRSLELLKGLVEERGAKVSADPLPEIEGNWLQLDCLVRNLIENAIKFQPGPNPQVVVRCQSEPQGWKLSVEDRGMGIPAEHKATVAQMFKRLHPADQFPGSGMGLALCQKVVELHQGRMDIADTPGGGTTVVVTLPLRQPVDSE